jgi:hypothetical protein
MDDIAITSCKFTNRQEDPYIKLAPFERSGLGIVPTGTPICSSQYWPNVEFRKRSGFEILPNQEFRKSILSIIKREEQPRVYSSWENYL